MKKLLILLMPILFGSCSKWNGKIEKREQCYEGIDRIDLEGSKKVYLINTSSNKRIQFTIKETGIDKTENSTTVDTYIQTLNPGEEKKIGCSVNEYKREYSKNFIEENTFEIVGELEVNEPAS